MSTSFGVHMDKVVVLEATFLKLTFAFLFFCIYTLHTHMYMHTSTSKWGFKNKHKCNNKCIFFRACKESLGRGGTVCFLLVNSLGCIWTEREKSKGVHSYL